MSNFDILLAFLVIAVLGVQPASAKVGDKCKNASLDCAVNECCAGVSQKILGVCQPQPHVNQTCTPRIRPGAKICPCAVGTTCTLLHQRKVSALKRKLNMKVKQYFECVAISRKNHTDEQEEK